MSPTARGVTTTASPANATVGALAVLGSTVTNHGAGAGSIDFTDTVPPGLTVDSASAGSGSCATAGQTVSRAIEGLLAGQSAPVSILVTPAAAGFYLNTASVDPRDGLVDPSPADNSAAATLDVAPLPRPPARACVVPGPRRVPLRTAKRLLGPLGRETGKVRHAHSSKVAKGKVIRTTPKHGSYVTGRTVGLVVSSGPPRHHHRRQHHHRRHG